MGPVLHRGLDNKWGGYTGKVDKYSRKIAKRDNLNLMAAISWKIGDKVDPGIIRPINDPQTQREPDTGFLIRGRREILVGLEGGGTAEE